MSCAIFFSGLVIKLYNNIKDLYSNIGMTARARDISKLIESFSSVTELTIHKNERVPEKTQHNMVRSQELAVDSLQDLIDGSNFKAEGLDKVTRGSVSIETGEFNNEKRHFSKDEDILGRRSNFVQDYRI
jgi:hypothetical protein